MRLRAHARRARGPGRALPVRGRRRGHPHPGRGGQRARPGPGRGAEAAARGAARPRATPRRPRTTRSSRRTPNWPSSCASWMPWKTPWTSKTTVVLTDDTEPFDLLRGGTNALETPPANHERPAPTPPPEPAARRPGLAEALRARRQLPRPAARTWLLVVLAYLGSGLFVVRQHERAMVLRCGKVRGGDGDRLQGAPACTGPGPAPSPGWYACPPARADPGHRHLLARGAAPPISRTMPAPATPCTRSATATWSRATPTSCTAAGPCATRCPIPTPALRLRRARAPAATRSWTAPWCAPPPRPRN